MKGKVYYFAYGSDMDANRMRERDVNFSWRRRDILKGYRLVFNKRARDNPKAGYANIVPDNECIVEGALYEIDEEGLNKLDKYEGFQKHYIRNEMLVECERKEYLAHVYAANSVWIVNGL